MPKTVSACGGVTVKEPKVKTPAEVARERARKRKSKTTPPKK